jgi:DNA polymerase I
MTTGPMTTTPRRVEIVFDLEADGLLPDATRAWCICTKTLDGTVNQFTPDNLQQGIDYLNTADHLIGHNILNYDLPLLDKLYGWRPNPSVKITDTVVKSRLLKPDRLLPANAPGNLAPHGLAAWGYRVGRGKPDHSDWTQFTPEMLHRCSEDVEINYLTYRWLADEEAKVRVDWSDALQTEQQIASHMTGQEINGVPFDSQYAWKLRRKLVSKIQRIDQEVVPLLPEVPLPKSQQSTWPSKQYKKDGTPTVQAIKYYGEDFGKDREYRTDLIIRTQPMNLGSEKQVKEYLMSIGWIPTEWNFKKDPKTGKPMRDMMGNKMRTSPKLTLSSLESCKWPENHADMGNKIVERLMLSHRAGMLAGFIRDLRPDGKLTASVNPMGTPTGRMTHRVVVNVPGNKAKYGKELRSCFVSEPGYTRVGIDLKSCQVYGLAHYLEDEVYRTVVTEGDQHQYAADLAGLEDRQDGKKLNYSILFGASDEKLASDLGISKAKAAYVRKLYFQGLPKLDALIRKLEAEWKQKGYITGLDGRAVWVRAKHMLLNYLLQSLEAIVMKNFINNIFLYHQIRNGVRWNYGDTFKLVTTMHDEVQFLVKDEHVEEFCDVARRSIDEVNRKFNLWCPQDIDINIGRTWSECH